MHPIGAPRCLALATALLLHPALALAQQSVPSAPTTDSARRRDTVHVLAGVNVQAARDPARVPALQRLTLQATATVSAAQASRSVNVVDAEDVVKYLPSVFIRKRNYGDTQATIATRVWGVSSSARSLVFADGVPLSALIANNNNIGGPRWGLVSPEEVARVDVMYGPFSAAYAGNSMGAVMEITTRQPDSLEGSVSHTEALQRFAQYGTSHTFGTSQTSATVGDRFGRFSLWAGAEYQRSHSQPLLYVTSPSFPSGTTGGYDERNKLGATADVIGASGLLQTDMRSARVKLAYDVGAHLRATYTVSEWWNDATSGVDSYLRASGTPTFAGQAGFATGYYALTQRHHSQSASLRSANLLGDWDGEVTVADFHFDRDQQRFPTTAASGDTTFGSAGRVAVLDGTGWSSVDLKAAWHEDGVGAAHIVSFGAHVDRYALRNPTFATAEWQSGDFGAVATEGDGATHTEALWAQDAWRVSSAVRLTLGGRLEHWRASDGFNANGNTSVSQPVVEATRFSPKAILAWTPSYEWTLTGSLGKAFRFATPAELYQLVSTGATFTAPDPNLRPDDVLALELRIMRNLGQGVATLSLFQDDVHDAIISQFLPIVAGSSTLYSAIANVEHVRARGAELSVALRGAGLEKLDVDGSVTYVDARTLALSGRASASAPDGSAVGKFLPNIPQWRGAVQGSWHLSDATTLSVAGRYSGKLYTTLDNADVNPNTFQGFAEWFVMDARAHWQRDAHWSASVGVDNLLDRRYFLFHPFPQRTLVLGARYAR